MTQPEFKAPEWNQCGETLEKNGKVIMVCARDPHTGEDHYDEDADAWFSFYPPGLNS